MALTLDNLLNDLKQTLRTFDQWSTAHAVADGVTYRFKLPDFPIIDPETMLCTVTAEDGTVTNVIANMYVLDPLTGWFAFYDPPGDDKKTTVIQWNWQFVPHTDEELVGLVNAGVRYVASDIKVEGLYDDETETELYVYEYAAPVGATNVKKVELRGDEYEPWRETSRWETLNKLGQRYVKFRQHPGIQQVRMWYDARPTLFAGTVADGIYTETFPTATLLPETAYDPVLHYAVWIALHRAMVGRSRDDAAQHQKGEASVTMRDLETRLGQTRTLFDLHLARFSSELEMGRIIQ